MRQRRTQKTFWNYRSSSSTHTLPGSSILKLNFQHHQDGGITLDVEKFTKQEKKVKKQLPHYELSKVKSWNIINSEFVKRWHVRPILIHIVFSAINNAKVNILIFISSRHTKKWTRNIAHYRCGIKMRSRGLIIQFNIESFVYTLWNWETEYLVRFSIPIASQNIANIKCWRHSMAWFEWYFQVISSKLLLYAAARVVTCVVNWSGKIFGCSRARK